MGSNRNRTEQSVVPDTQISSGLGQGGEWAERMQIEIRSLPIRLRDVRGGAGRMGITGGPRMGRGNANQRRGYANRALESSNGPPGGSAEEGSLGGVVLQSGFSVAGCPG